VVSTQCIVTTTLSCTVSEILPHLRCTWLPQSTCHLQRSFIYEKTVEITIHVRFIIHTHVHTCPTFSEVWKSESYQTAKVTFKVIQGHCLVTGANWQNAYDFIVFHWNTFLTCTTSKILSLIFQNLKRSRDLEYIPSVVIYHACTSTPRHQSAHGIRSAYIV